MDRDPKRNPLIQTFLKYNSILNLSAIRDEEWVYTKHILDSLELLKCFDFANIKTLADIGTGGWFPLLPLAMSYPEIHCTGIDSVRKKLQAIQDMCLELHIDNCSFSRTRLEECSTKYDCITARAVAHVEKLFPRIEKMLKPWTKLILYKQWKADEVLENPKQSERAIMMDMLGQYKLKCTTEHIYSLFPGDIERVIYILERQWI